MNESVTRSLEMYHDGMSCLDISRNLAISKATIKYWVKKHGLSRTAIETRNIKTDKMLYTKKRFNIDFTINSPERAWILGLFCGDGCFCSKNHLEIASSNFNFLKKVRDIISNDTPILNKQRVFSIKFYAPFLFKELKKMMPEKVVKGLQIHFPASLVFGNEEFFWRGYFEADGTIYAHKLAQGQGYRTKITSISERMVRDYQNFLSGIIPCYSRKKEGVSRSKISKNDAYSVKLGTIESGILMNYIYKNKLDMVFSPKYNKYLRLEKDKCRLMNRGRLIG